MSNDWYSNDYDDDYETNYDQYDGCNGWSDDVINNAFDGDPSATWNID